MPQTKHSKNTTLFRKPPPDRVSTLPLRKHLLELFKPGDLLYGLKHSRHPYVEQLKTKGFTEVCVSQLNKHDGSFLFEHDYEASDFRQKLTPAQRKQLDFLISHRSRIQAPGGKDPEQSSDHSVGVTNAQIRRSCKLTAIHSKSLARRVHYILDDVDHQRVADKVTKDGKPDFSFSSSEIRALFRARDTLGDHVLFYKKGLCVKPPWEVAAHRHHYQRYSQRRNTKKLKHLQAKIHRPNLFQSPPSSLGTKISQLFTPR